MIPITDLVATYQAYAAANSSTQTPQTLYAPIDYIMTSSGKQLRPALLLAAYNLYAEEVASALPAAHAIEVFHNFTLMHDDIMDAAPLRRGQPTVYKQYGTNTAILSGDAMLILAYQYLAKAATDAHLRSVNEVFSRTAIEVCEGQQYDIDFETRTDVSINEYVRMIELKTSVLLAAALQIGATLGGAPSADATQLYEFGRNVGIAFQLQDDILDTFGDDTFGKRIGGDIVSNKKTFLYLKALELASTGQKNALEYWYHLDTFNEAEKISAVTAIFNEIDVRTHAEALMEAFYKKGMKAMSALPIDPTRKLPLKGFATALLHRTT